MDKNIFFTRKAMGLLIAVFLILIAAAAFAVKMDKNETKPQSVTDNNERTERGEIDADLSKVVLNVRNMSCSGCISTIKGALAGLQGINDILVDIGGEKVEVYYDKENLKDVMEIEKAISASGYPAKVLRVISAEEIRKERAKASSKAEYYIASVNGYDIARADFTIEMNAAIKKFKKNYGDDLFQTAQGKALDSKLRAQVASRLIDEGILLQEINKSGYKLDKNVINAELTKYLQKSGRKEGEFQQELKDSGYSYDYFKKKFETGLMINRYLDEKVLAEASTPYEKQRVFTAWFNNSKTLSDVVYYDKDLEKAIRNQSASGSCCQAQ